MLPDSVVKDVRGATHVLAYALRATKLINNRQSHYERELIFAIDAFFYFEIITLYDNKLVRDGIILEVIELVSLASRGGLST